MTMQSIVSVFGSLAHTLQQIIEHPNMVESVAHDVRIVYDAIVHHLYLIEYETQSIIESLPINSASVNGTLIKMTKQIQQTIASLNNGW